MEGPLDFWVSLGVGIATIYLFYNVIFGKKGVASSAGEGESGSALGKGLGSMLGGGVAAFLLYDILNKGPVTSGVMGLFNWLVTAGGIIPPIDWK